MFSHRPSKRRRNVVSKHLTQLYLELSTHCTLSCRTCPRNAVIDFTPEHFPLHLADRLMESIAQIPTLERIVLLGYGEALCNPDVASLLTRLAGAEIPIVLVTNAQLVTPELLDLFIELPLHSVYVSWDDLGQQKIIRVGSDRGRTVDVVAELRNRRKNQHPIVGVEIVALKSNQDVLPGIVSAARSAGAEHIMVTNVFPYNREMRTEILFSYKRRPETDLQLTLGWKPWLEIASQIITNERACPFLERGTLFVTAVGDVVPCPELTHSHTAWYFNAERMHYRFILGNISQRSLAEIWEDGVFDQFRSSFEYYEFPDCLQCSGTEMCLHRSSMNGDCFHNGAPCGECLWASGIIRCP
ncbi:MAG: SPASM domain-containing protein [Desulfomonilia bacterium]|nr:SPASM domain-containing protein [Desulfomonilia bacterium]